MDIQQVEYDPGSGWNAPLDDALDSDSTLILLFGPSDIESIRPVLEGIRARFPRSTCMGCSSAGHFRDSRIEDRSLQVTLIRFHHTRLSCQTTLLEGAENSYTCGAALASRFDGDGLRVLLVLSDGLNVNGSQLVEGLASVLPDGILISGGLAADGDRFAQTWVCGPASAGSGHVVAVGFYGERLGLAHGSRGGWDPLGPQRLVTRSAANVLFELDGQPALEVYRRYLGSRADELPGAGLLFPLAICDEDGERDDTVRTLLAIDPDAGSITFAGDVPVGSKVTLMHANFERLIDAAGEAAEQITGSQPIPASAIVIAISCVGRRLVLGSRAEEELEEVAEAFPAQIRLAGYYSYGEISPLSGGTCSLKNQTMTLTALWEY